ncbi:hypothetical protein CDAR_303751 [Caerostris darwini]|uniref:Uncharacterized protein n=1 Tax=Caerostris darwini TaxID=1538125 RepID=A0AAV4T716_9ARAC|nr:hypothetical protein CDAR_303751 [Caerostris darwini]
MPPIHRVPVAQPKWETTRAQHPQVPTVAASHLSPDTCPVVTLRVDLLLGTGQPTSYDNPYRLQGISHASYNYILAIKVSPRQKVDRLACSGDSCVPYRNGCSPGELLFCAVKWLR